MRGGSLATAAVSAMAGVALRSGGGPVLAASSVTVHVDLVSACPQPSVLAVSDCFRPDVATVPSGGTVTWTNMTSESHTLARCTDACPHGRGSGADSPFGASSQMPGPGTSYSFTFTGPGTYYYDCSAGECAVGEIIVTAPSASPTPVVLSPGPGTAPSATPNPSPTPAPTPSPTASPSDAVPAVATPTSDASPGAFAPDVAGAPGAGGGGGSSLVIIVLVVLTLIAVGGGVLSFRMFRG